MRLLEGGLRGVEVSAALGAPDHLERLALHRRLVGRAAPSRAARASAKRGIRFRPAHGGLGGQGIGPGQMGRVALGEDAGVVGVGLGVIPPSGRQVGGAQHEVDVGPLLGIRAQGQQLGAQRRSAGGLARLRARRSSSRPAA